MTHPYTPPVEPRCECGHSIHDHDFNDDTCDLCRCDEFLEEQ